MIKPDKWQQLQQRMSALGILDDDLHEKFILGSGSGGQKIQKTSSCVYLKHTPSGIEIKCQQHRYREHNRYVARQRLCDKIEDIQLAEKSKRQQAIEKIKRQKKRRSRRAKQKILDEKLHRSKLKKSRQEPQED